MEVFVRDELKKEYELDNDYTYIACKGNVIYPNLKSLDQHDAEVRNKVIDELLEWINENKNDYMCRANTQHISGKSFSPHMAGASITVYTDGFVDELKEKLTEIKEKQNE